MPRQRSDKRDKAFEIWLLSDGKIKLKDIAAQLEVQDTQIRKWKNQDKWDEKLKSNVTNSKGNVTKKRGAPKGNQRAKGNPGGAAPIENKNAERHGFFSRIFPDDPETLSIVNSIDTKGPLDILWENIVIQYTAIARAQRIMYVKDQADSTSTKIGESSGDRSSSEKWEIQHAWDKQANFLQAQSRAMKTLEGLIARYDELLPGSMKHEEQRLRIEKLKVEIIKIKDDPESETPNDGFIEALKNSSIGVWDDEENK